MKEEAKEIVQAVSETIKERASNPIIVTFIISWCVYNWNALLLLAFSKETIAKRIDIASQQFIETESWFLPVIFTVGYCLLSKPLNAGLRKLMEKIDHFVISLEYSREMTKQKHEEQLEILKAKAEMAYDSTKTDEKNKIQKMNEEITKSKEREGALTKEIDELKKEKELNINEMKELQKTNSMQQAEINTLFLENEKLTKHLEQNGNAAKDKEIRELTLKLNDMTAIRNEYEAQAKRFEEKLKNNGWVNG